MMGKIRRVANAQSVRNDSPALHCRALCFVRARGTSAEHHGGHFQRRREKT